MTNGVRKMSGFASLEQTQRTVLHCEGELVGGDSLTQTDVNHHSVLCM